MSKFNKQSDLKSIKIQWGLPIYSLSHVIEQQQNNTYNVLIVLHIRAVAQQRT